MIDAPIAPTLDRRTILAGAAVLAGAATLPPLLRSGRPDRLAAFAAGAARRASVAFAGGLGDASAVPELDALSGARALPAAGLRRGDAALAGRTIRLAFSGLTPGAEARVGDADLDTLLPPAADGDDQPLRHMTWTVRGETVPRTANRTALVAAVATPSPFGVEVSSPALRADGAAAATTVFTLGRGTDLAKLWPGLYLIGLAPGIWDRPRTLPAVDDPRWQELPSVVLRVSAVEQLR